MLATAPRFFLLGVLNPWVSPIGSTHGCVLATPPAFIQNSKFKISRHASGVHSKFKTFRRKVTAEMSEKRKGSLVFSGNSCIFAHLNRK